MTKKIMSAGGNLYTWELPLIFYSSRPGEEQNERISFKEILEELRISPTSSLRSSRIGQYPITLNSEAVTPTSPFGKFVTQELLSYCNLAIMNNTSEEIPDKEIESQIDLLAKLVAQRFHQNLAGFQRPDGTFEPAVWIEGIPSIQQYSYRLWVDGGDICVGWVTPHDGEEVYRISRNSANRVPTEKVIAKGLNIFLSEKLLEDSNDNITLQAFFPDWTCVLGELLQEHPLKDAIEKSPLFEQGISVKIKEELLKVIVSLKSDAVIKGRPKGSGIKYFDDPCPSEVQVWPKFFDLFDSQDPYQIPEPIRERVSRIVVNRELFVAKLYASLRPHSGSAHKAALYIQGAGSSHKSYFLEKFLYALEFIWYSDGTVKVDPSKTGVPSAWVKKDLSKGDRFDDLEQLQKAVFLYWTEVKGYKPDKEFFKKMQGTDTYKGEEKHQTERQVPISFINIFDSNYPISGNWFTPQAYDRVIPVGFFNPVEGVEDPTKYYYFADDVNMQDPKLHPAKEVIRNWRELTASDLATAYTAWCTMRWVLTYGKVMYLKHKGEKSIEISCDHKNVRELAKVNLDTTKTIRGLLESRTKYHSKYNFEGNTFILTLFSLITLEGGSLSHEEYLAFIHLWSKKYASSDSGQKKQITTAILQGADELEGVLAEPVSAYRYLGFKVSRGRNSIKFENIHINPKYQKYIEEEQYEELFEILLLDARRDLKDAYLSVKLNGIPREKGEEDEQEDL